MNVAIFSRTFDGVTGGVEKMVLTLASELHNLNHCVFVISLDTPESKAFYEWPKGVSWEKINLGNPNVKASFLVRAKRVSAIRKILKQNRIHSAVGFQIGAFALLRMASLGLRIHTVAAERNAPTLFRFIQNGAYKRFITNIILSTADVISVQLESNKFFYPKMLWRKISITPNPILQTVHHKTDSKVVNDPKIILYVGRVTYQKNLEVLVTAISMLKVKPKLRIVGAGDSLHTVISLAEDLKVELDIFPFTVELSSIYCSADVFCLPSRWEGFPNVVGEALSHGLPVVAFEGCAGISSLVENFKSGLVASGNDDPVTLSQALSQALTYDWDPLAVRQTTTKYSLEFFLNAWESVLFPKANCS